MADFHFKKIEYFDLRKEVKLGKLPIMIGRAEEIDRLTRVVTRKISNNALVVGANGIGKTTLVYGWAKKMIERKEFDSLQFVQLDAEHLYELENETYAKYFEQALVTLPSSVLFIDNFGRAVMGNSGLLKNTFRLYQTLLKKSHVRMILSLEPNEYAWLEREFPAFVKSFETIQVKNQTSLEYAEILERALPHLNAEHILVSGTALKEIVAYVERFPKLGQLPRGAVSLLDESLAYAVSLGEKGLIDDIVASVVAGKTGIPKAQLKPDELHVLKNLESVLNERIINQKGPIKKIAATLQRAKLGIRNPNKPLGSFLMLGPSGVGKTETAKLIAENMFGRSQTFIRFDMSEFGQDHTVQRLLGAPAGYIGYESGGALTNALREEPHCLILLDEIEKAHPKIFDIFLQVLDDGRLTSGQNETVDARHSIIMATSNVAVDEILKGFEKGIDIGSEAFLKEKIIPALSKIFRLEFLNRFDSILIFNPLSLKGLVEVAQLEIKKIEKRLSKHKVQFNIDPTLLEARIKTLVDPRFGARPVKRFIEETCESLLARSLLNKK
ncbi:MAG: AAA family ATPase [Candidatus Pacebacteria bacterium]|nr:AAA family ATPase [Candidatus Paceibacterota bacterium]